jgi:REP element-mobilizing transposase RayT
MQPWKLKLPVLHYTGSRSFPNPVPNLENGNQRKSLFSRKFYMANYRRVYTPGATWFFTVNLAERSHNTLLIDKIDSLRQAFRYVKQRHPFHIDAIVVMPDHLHTLWTLPEGDTDFSTRWNLLKGHSFPALSKKANEFQRAG